MTILKGINTSLKNENRHKQLCTYTVYHSGKESRKSKNPMNYINVTDGSNVFSIIDQMAALGLGTSVS